MGWFIDYVVTPIKGVINTPANAVKEVWSTYKSIISEGDTLSTKRWLSVSLGFCVCFTSVWVDLKHPEMIVTIHNSDLIFICLLLGLASFTQVVSIINRTPITPPKEDTTNDTKTQ